ncbi:MAG: hypothetical protein AAGK04_02110 [Planctomycetota bacterium]
MPAKLKLKVNPKKAAETLGFKDKKKAEDAFKKLASGEMEEEEVMLAIGNLSKKEKLGFDKPKDVEKKLKEARII